MMPADRIMDSRLRGNDREPLCHSRARGSPRFASPENRTFQTASQEVCFRKTEKICGHYFYFVKFEPQRRKDAKKRFFTLASSRLCGSKKVKYKALSGQNEISGACWLVKQRSLTLHPSPFTIN